MFNLKRKTKRSKAKAKPFNASSDEYFTSPTKEEEAEIYRILEAKNCFEVLDVDPTLDLDKQEDVLRDKYLSKCLLLKPNEIEHPKLDAAFKKLMNSYDVLCDPEKRAKHRREHYAEDMSMEEFLSNIRGHGHGAGSGPVLITTSNGEAPMIITSGPGGPGNLMSLGPLSFFAPPPSAAVPQASRGGGFFVRPPPVPTSRARTQQQPLRERVDRLAAARERRDRMARRRTQWEQDSDESADGSLDLADLMFGSFFSPRRPRPADVVLPRAERETERSNREQRQGQRDQNAAQETQQDSDEEEEQEPNYHLERFLNMMASNLMATDGRMQPRRPPATAAAPPPRRPRYERQMEQLSVMGFSNRDLNRRALELANGNVEAAANLLLNQQSFQ